MSRPGTPDQPLRVAIVGAGPAAFYAAEQLLRQPGLAVEVDMLDRLPTPFGLVRGGVAPDHQKIKAVTAAFDRIAALPGFRFFGGVELGKHVERRRSAPPLSSDLLRDGGPDRPAHGHPRRGSAAKPSRHRVRGVVQRPSRLSGLPVRSLPGARGRGRGRQRGHRRRPDAEPHPGRAGKDRHRRLRAGGAPREPGARGVPPRPARARSGGLHEPRDQGTGGAGRRRRRGRCRRRPRSTS